MCICIVGCIYGYLCGRTCQRGIVSMLDLGVGGCAIQTPIHFEDFACPCALKIMSQLCGELCWAREWRGVVRLCDLVCIY